VKDLWFYEAVMRGL